jgi:hypothetical protein
MMATVYKLMPAEMDKDYAIAAAIANMRERGWHDVTFADFQGAGSGKFHMVVLECDQPNAPVGGSLKDNLTESRKRKPRKRVVG